MKHIRAIADTVGFIPRSQWLTLFVTLGILVPTANGEERPDQLLTTTLAKWKKLDSQIQSYQIVTTHTDAIGTSPENRSIKYTGVKTVTASSDGVVSNSRFEDRGEKSVKTLILLFNATYDAVLEEPTEGRGLTLTSIELPSKGKWQNYLASHEGNSTIRHRLPWLWIRNNTDLYHLITDPRFKPIRVEDTGTEADRLHFVIDRTVTLPEGFRPSPINGIQWVQAGFFDIDRSEYALLTGFRFQLEVGKGDKQYRYDEIGMFEYAPKGRSQFPILRKVVIETPPFKLPGGSLSCLLNEATVEVEYNKPVDNQQFWLTHYGLPEPEGVTPPKKPIPLYVWLLSAAAGLGLIALVCRWLLHRRSAKTVPVAPPPAA